MRKRTILLILLIGSTVASLRESYSAPQAALLESRVRELEGRVSMLQSELTAQDATLKILMQDYEERKRHQQ